MLAPLLFAVARISETAVIVAVKDKEKLVESVSVTKTTYVKAQALVFGRQVLLPLHPDPYSIMR